MFYEHSAAATARSLIDSGRAGARSAPYDRLAVWNHRYAAHTSSPLSRRADRTPPSVIESGRRSRDERSWNSGL